MATKTEERTFQATGHCARNVRGLHVKRI